MVWCASLEESCSRATCLEQNPSCIERAHYWELERDRGPYRIFCFLSLVVMAPKLLSHLKNNFPASLRRRRHATLLTGAAAWRTSG